MSEKEKNRKKEKEQPTNNLVPENLFLLIFRGKHNIMHTNGTRK